MSDGPPGERRDVVRLQSMRQHLKSIDNAHGGGTELPMVWGYVRQEVIPILYGGRYSPSRSLRDPVARFYCGIGWAAYDADQQELATKYFTGALRSARTVGDRIFSARVLAAMSHQAVYLGRVQQAIDFAEAASNDAPTGHPARSPWSAPCKPALTLPPGTAAAASKP
jgi:hypothetical protein